MTFFFSEFFPIFFYILFSGFLASLIFFASYLFANQNPYSEKLSPYECGFDPFDDARNTFEIRFYLVAILFLIFDLEASFLFPWAITLSKINFIAFWSIMDFFFELAVGFFYAWKIGSLEWTLF